MSVLSSASVWQGGFSTNSIYNPMGREAIRQQRVVRMMLLKPRHDFRSLRMQDELATLQAYGCPFGDALALHDSTDVIK